VAQRKVKVQPLPSSWYFDSDSTPIRSWPCFDSSSMGHANDFSPNDPLMCLEWRTGRYIANLPRCYLWVPSLVVSRYSCTTRAYGTPSARIQVTSWPHGLELEALHLSKVRGSRLPWTLCSWVGHNWTSCHCPWNSWWAHQTSCWWGSWWSIGCGWWYKNARWHWFLEGPHLAA
jgi:hypothetical protein